MPPDADPQADHPLFAGSLLGLRGWSVNLRLPFRATHLGASYRGAMWRPGGEWTEARCHRGASHAAPDHDCSCGLYAWHPTAEWMLQVYGAHVQGAGPVGGVDCEASELTVGGVVEMAGRIEVHRDGLRAERARPVALVASRRWSDQEIEATAELADLYGAELLEMTGVRQVLDWCRERGGVLGTTEVSRLLGPVAKPPAPSPKRPAPAPAAPSAPAAAPEQPGPLDRVLRVLRRTAGNVVLGFFMAVQAVFAIAIFGIPALAIAGGIFGWFEPEPKPPLPVRVMAVSVDRDRCRVHATFEADRAVEEMRVRVAGRLANGEGMGHFEFKAKDIERGVTTRRVATPPPKACSSRGDFAVRVRTVWPGRLGRAVEVTSTADGPDVRKAIATTTPSAR